MATSSPTDIFIPLFLLGQCSNKSAPQIMADNYCRVRSKNGMVNALKPTRIAGCTSAFLVWILSPRCNP